MQNLDEHDIKLLQLLQQNNRLTAEELTQKINLSQSSIQRRMTRLRSEKYIEADVAIISPKAVGYYITSVVNVVLKEGSSKAIDKFKTQMQDCTEVAQCYYVTGNYDFVLVVNTKDMNHFEKFSKRYLMDNPNLKHFYTHVVMDKVKVNYGIAL